MGMGSELSAHQKLLLEMLKDFDAVCRRHGIRYQLFAGSALGAVRHNGFIPWDDDLDVILSRSEYERFFREAAMDFDPEIYYVQQEHSPHWSMHFSKLRRNGTTCIEKYHPKDPGIHQGVYIDIFPYDNLASSPFQRRLQFAASKVIIAKALWERGYETSNVAKKLFLQVCRLLPRRSMERVCMRRDDTESRMVHSFLAAGRRYKKNIFPRTWLDDCAELPFEDGVFPVSTHYDALLTRLYGDYRNSPRPEERKCKEHVAIFDLNSSYEGHLKEQKEMHFAIHTRSIR